MTYLKYIFATGFAVIFFLLLSYRLDVAPDIHMDEIIYYRTAHNLATTGEFTWDVNAIFVHPPMQFLTQAFFLSVFGLTDEFRPFQGTYNARILNALAASLTAGMLYLLLTDLAGNRAALLSVSLLILDPFVLRINRRNMLESMAEMWVILGLYLFWQRRDRLTPSNMLLIGLVFGVALLTKELTIFGFAVLPIFVIIRGRWTDLRKVAAMGVVAACIWSLFPFWSWSVGQSDAFFDNKLYNFRRLTGQVQVSGWNREGVSFVGALEVNVQQYATSYALILISIFVSFILFFTWRTEASRFILAWVGIMYAFFAYSIAGGALNDQFFYFFLVPVISVIGTGAARWLSYLILPKEDSHQAKQALILQNIEALPSILVRIDDGLMRFAHWLAKVGQALSRHQLLRASLIFLLLAVGVLVQGYNAYRWVKLFAIEQDNALYQLSTHIQTTVPPETEINSMFEDLELTLHLMLPNHNLVTLRDPDDIASQEVRYAILSSKNLWGRYGRITPDYYEWVKANGEPIFQTYGNTYWQVELYRLEME
ncbi:MAG: glycosyltransferase family 39 protein [Chloroflexota bacterium]